jgi:AraC-like DNA-binding protein
MEYYSRAAKKFLDLNWNKKIYKNSGLKYDDLADLIGLPKYRPSLKMCKRNFGLTIEKFYIHCRVSEIKEYLAKPESRQYELIEIAHKLGYPHRRNFNQQFKDVEGITQREFWYFHEHFIEKTGLTLVEYEQPKIKRYMPPDDKPTFLSNYLNRQMSKVLYNERYE